MSYQQIVWLASYPKSGNTWVRTFLDAYFLGELDLNELVCSVTDDRKDRYQIGDGSDINNAPVDIQHLARPMNLLRLVKAFNANRFADVPLYVKTHNPNMIVNGVELLPRQLTRATIFIVRDPRDVLPSFAKHMGTDLDQAIEWMTDKWRVLNGTENKVMDLISSWSEHTKSFLNNPPCTLVKYEDMRADPEREFTRILEASGAPVDPIRIRKALDMVDLQKLRQREARDGFKESSPHAKDQFFGKGLVGGWQDKLTPRQAHALEKAFRRTMKRLDYGTFNIRRA
jgi:hypothetical protein